MMRPTLGFVALVLALAAMPALAQNVEFSDLEKRRILRAGPWPPPLANDPSNRVSGKAEAIALGRALFFDTRVSGNGAISCATCHDPAKSWADGMPRGQGMRQGARNSPSLVNVRFNRWFGWDGGHDSLWAQSLRPILDDAEMGGARAKLAGLLRADGKLSCLYRAAFAREAGAVDEEILAVDAAKALAAFQETIVSGRSAFDDFRDALQAGSDDRAYPADARRGLKIFMGSGNCHFCHFGPAFTNGEFADIGVSYFIAPGVVDAGRHEGIKRLRASADTLLGPFNDDPGRANATATAFVRAEPRNFGEFRVPGLRDVAASAPYMHNGAKASLHDVVRHYSEVDEERLHTEGERIIRPLHLRSSEIDDVVAFLKTLSSRQPPQAAAAIAACPG